MGLSFVERFFKLTLDNVYRFACSSLFAVSIWGIQEGTRPLIQLTWLLDWLSIPSTWVSHAIEWMAMRNEVVSNIAMLMLLISVLFAAINGGSNRSGSTALLSIVILMQAGTLRVFLWPVMICIIVFACIGIAAAIVWPKMTGARPAWIKTVWGKFLTVVVILSTAALSLLSPLVWLISGNPRRTQGTRLDPLYFKNV